MRGQAALGGKQPALSAHNFAVVVVAESQREPRRASASIRRHDAQGTHEHGEQQECQMPRWKCGPTATSLGDLHDMRGARLRGCIYARANAPSVILLSPRIQGVG
jgi:hypothetical protein